MSFDTGAGDIVCGLEGGRRLALYAPVGPGLCERCRARAEDVCYRINGPSGQTVHGALCGRCLEQLLVDGGRAATAEPA